MATSACILAAVDARTEEALWIASLVAVALAGLALAVGEVVSVPAVAGAASLGLLVAGAVGVLVLAFRESRRDGGSVVRAIARSVRTVIRVLWELVL